MRRLIFHVLIQAAMLSTLATPRLHPAQGSTRDGWQDVARLGTLAARTGHTAVWTGSEMLVWGGTGRAGVPIRTANAGFKYNPTTDTWSPISTRNAPIPTSGHTAVWTGREMIVWGGTDPPPGGRYDPFSDSWSPISSLNSPIPTLGHSAVWTGQEMIIWGGYGVGNAAGKAGRYNPTSDTWTPISAVGALRTRYGHSSVWTGKEMIVWGGLESSGSAAYDPKADLWRALPRIGAPSGRWLHIAIWTGKEMIVWGGATNETDYFAWGIPGVDDGARYDPVLDRWFPLERSGSPSARLGHTAVWTGSEIIIWGGGAQAGGVVGPQSYFDSGAAYSPERQSWRSITSQSAPDPRFGHTAVWTGREMVIWGGRGRTGPLDTGGRYVP